MSADNSIPERHIVIETLRKAAPYLGLKPSVLATLDALISCLPPKRGHHTVFASNATLVFRRNGISDRTIRRHVATLQDSGLLERHDSPNRKRYTRRNTTEGVVLRFGFDLTPLYHRFADIAALAAQAAEDTERLDYMKAKLRTAAHELLANDPHHEAAIEALRALRRKLSVAACEEMIASLSQAEIKAETPDEETAVTTPEMSGADGQNVRHYHNSNIELKDKKEEEPQNKRTGEDTTLSLNELVESCPNAVEFAVLPINSIEDVVAHARTLAPMLGIDDSNYHASVRELGHIRTAITVWALTQIHDRIRQIGAYFRSITTGKNKHKFDPVGFIKRLTPPLQVQPV